MPASSAIAPADTELRRSTRSRTSGGLPDPDPLSSALSAPAAVVRRPPAPSRPAAVAPTKLVPPAEPAGFVPRPRLHALLAEATRQRVTVVSAHAGTGKSVLLASYCRTLDPARVAWVGPRPRGRLGAEAVVACRRRPARTRGRTAPRTARRRPRGGHPLAPARPTASRCCSSSTTSTSCAAPRCSSSWRRCSPTRRTAYGWCSPPARIPACGCSACAWPATWRRSARPTSPSPRPSARACWRRPACTSTTTRSRSSRGARRAGRPASRLAALSLRGEPDPAHLVRRFAGDDAAVMDYLLSEILDRQPPDLVDFLLRTSVPDVVTPELADELTGRTDGGRVLARLQAENFLVSRPAERRPRLPLPHAAARVPARAAGVRAPRRARPACIATSARWHRDHGWPATAFEHALQAGDWQLAEAIYGESWHLLRVVATTRAGRSPPRRGRRELPCAGPARRRPGRGQRYGARGRAAGRAGRGAAGRGATRRTTTRAASSPRSRGSSAPGGVATMPRCWRSRRACSRCRRCMADDPPRARVVQALALAHLGAAQAALGRFDEAETSLRLALAAALETHLDAVVLQARSGLAVLDAARGRLRSAALAASSAVDFAASRGWQAPPRTPAAAEAALAWARYQWDELEEAATARRRREARRHRPGARRRRRARGAGARGARRGRRGAGACPRRAGRAPRSGRIRS